MVKSPFFPWTFCVESYFYQYTPYFCKICQRLHEAGYGLMKHIYTCTYCLRLYHM